VTYWTQANVCRLQPRLTIPWCHFF
jgi:hypothetical protein